MRVTEEEEEEGGGSPHLTPKSNFGFFFFLVLNFMSSYFPCGLNGLIGNRLLLLLFFFFFFSWHYFQQTIKLAFCPYFPNNTNVGKMVNSSQMRASYEAYHLGWSTSILEGKKSNGGAFLGKKQLGFSP